MENYITDEKTGLEYKLVETITNKASNKILPKCAA